MKGLLHDGAEAFNGDLIRPLKYSPEFREPFKRVEDLNDAAVSAHFGFDDQDWDLIKHADNVVCATESLQIVPKSEDQTWPHGAEVSGTETVWEEIEIEMFNPWRAMNFFLDRYRQLMVREKRQQMAA